MAIVTAEASALRSAHLPMVRADAIVCAALAVVTAVYVVLLQQMLAYTNFYLDIWFDSDSLFIVGQETDRWSKDNNTNSRHPIFSLVTFPIGYALTLLGLSPDMAVLPILVLYSTLFVVTAYVILRLMDRPVGVALVFTGILAVSTPGMFFLGLHERLIPAGFSILLLIAAFLAYQRKLASPVWLTVAAALTLGITVTNFAYALVALPLLLGLKKGVQGLANAFAAIAFISIFVPVLFPLSSFFLDVKSYPYETTSFSGDAPRLERAGSPTDRASAILLHSIAMPTPEIEQKPYHEEVHYLSVQKVGVAGQQPIWYVALALWFALLGGGLYAAFLRMWNSRLLSPAGLGRAIREGAEDPLPWMLVISVLGQMALFMLYGAEAILFSSYFVPALIFIAAMAWKPGRPGRVILGLAILLLVVLAWNNGAVFLDAAAVGETLIPVQDAVRQ